MRKMTLILLVLLSVSMVFANGKSDTAASEEMVELSLFWRVGQYAIDETNPIVQEITAKTGVKLNYLSIPWNGYADKLNLSIASGDMADIIMHNGPTNTNSYQWADQGIFLELDEYLNDAPNIVKKVPKELMEQLRMPDGGTYFIPRLWSAPHVFIIRDDLLAKYNLKAPTTLDEFLKVSEVLSQDYDENGEDDTYAFGGFGFLFWTRWVSTAYDLPRTKFKKIDGEWKYCDTVPESKEWVAFLKKIYDEGIMDPEILVLGGSEGREKFYQGKFAMAGMRLDDVDRANDTFQKAGSDSHVTAFPTPKGPNGKGGYWFGAPVDDNGIGYWMVASLANTCEEPEAAVKVMDFMMSDEGTELGFWGREGIEFKRDPVKKYEWLVDLGEREKMGLPLYVNFLTGEPIYGEAAGNPWAPEAQVGIKAAQKSIYNDFLQIVPSNDTIIELTSDLGTFCDEQITNFVMGNRPMDEFDDYIAEWYARGGTELLAEITKEMAAQGQ
jgi:putative aldouronate transport system substrate-binding protein